MRKIEKGEISMLNEEICKLRDKLNKSIENGDDYSITYKLTSSEETKEVYPYDFNLFITYTINVKNY